MSIKWALSVLDFQHHAIDERAYHPIGVYRAQCEHLLMMIVQLHDEPYGKTCAACAGRQFASAVKS
jgi:hypothetical protein